MSQNKCWNGKNNYVINKDDELWAYIPREDNLSYFY